MIWPGTFKTIIVTTLLLKLMMSKKKNVVHPNQISSLTTIRTNLHLGYYYLTSMMQSEKGMENTC